jgi:uncharacterized protein (TIGR03437 family)
MNGHPWPIVAVDSSQITVQVPWNAPAETGRPELELGVITRSPFESTALLPGLVGVTGYFPQWLRFDRSSIAALHEDFSAPVTRGRPARAGEIVHAYGTGFGTVDPRPETGVSATAAPLSKTVDPIVCSLAQGNDPVPVEVLYSGLAPGLIGVYQIDLRLPADVPVPEAFIYCRAASQEQMIGGALPTSPE